MITTNETYPWSFVTQIFRNVEPSYKSFTYVILCGSNTLHISASDMSEKDIVLITEDSLTTVTNSVMRSGNVHDIMNLF